MNVLAKRSPVAALVHKVAIAMDVILHIGAHRSASTTFQHYLRGNLPMLRRQGVGFLGPLRTRNGGLLSGVVPADGAAAPGELADRARPRIAKHCDRAAKKGLRHLIISDENILGSVRRNLRQLGLYRDAVARLDLFAAAFDGRVGRVVFALRALEDYWSSALAYGVSRGHPLPDAAALDRFADRGRSWRDVIEETAAAFPGAEIQVQDHETLAGRPDRRLWHMLGGAVEAPLKDARLWLNRAPDLDALRDILRAQGDDPARLPPGQGRWMPFDETRAAALREAHADDMFWLRAGADGRAKLIEEVHPETGGTNLPGRVKTRGHDDDGQDGRMAHAS